MAWFPRKSVCDIFIYIYNITPKKTWSDYLLPLGDVPENQRRKQVVMSGKIDFKTKNLEDKDNSTMYQ
jgi:hypothetical protein